MGFLQQFHIWIKYKKVNSGKLSNMLSNPSTSKTIVVGTLVHMDPFKHDVYKDVYIEYGDFKYALVATWPIFCIIMWWWG